MKEKKIKANSGRTYNHLMNSQFAYRQRPKEKLGNYIELNLHRALRDRFVTDLSMFNTNFERIQ